MLNVELLPRLLLQASSLVIGTASLLNEYTLTRSGKLEKGESALH